MLDIPLPTSQFYIKRQPEPTTWLWITLKLGFGVWELGFGVWGNTKLNADLLDRSNPIYLDPIPYWLSPTLEI